MVLVWHRADLRLHDHPALLEASKLGALLPVFVLDPALLETDYAGPGRVAFLLENLRALNAAYQRLGLGLLLCAGQPEAELLRLARELRVGRVFALRSLEPVGVRRDARVKATLEANGVEFRVFASDCVLEPGLLRSNTGAAYRVFTPFYRAWLAAGLPLAQAAPAKLEPLALPASVGLPVVRTSLPLPAAGEDAALASLEDFVAHKGAHYEATRNLPALDGTSMLSAHLHLGVLSPRWAAQRALRHTAWVRELCWRDFYRHILVDQPRLEHEAFKSEWHDFAWRDHTSAAKTDFQAWCAGQTGIPIVDAGMRQLAQTGWMHNRVRMIVASFLTKHLLIDWRAGAAHFNQLLIDGDLASNNGGWQWTAGCGVDAAPYFRVFNPVTQSEKFDPEGAYIRRFVPELEGLPERFVHQPWLAPKPPKYAQAMVDLQFGRQRFLEVAKAHFANKRNP